MTVGTATEKANGQAANGVSNEHVQPGKPTTDGLLQVWHGKRLITECSMCQSCAV